MRSSLVAGAACALALFVVCTLVTHIPRSSSGGLSSLLSTGAKTGTANGLHSSSELSSNPSSNPVLASSHRPQLTERAVRLRGANQRSSLASIDDAVRFNADASFNFGRMEVQTSVGFTVVAHFAFADHVGTWERIYDFGPFWGGAGQGMGVILSREGNSNNLITHVFTGPDRPVMIIRVPTEIRPNLQMTAVSTYQCTPATVRFVRVQARRSYLQIGFLSVQTADGTNVALGKRAYASGTYPGTDPNRAVNGPAQPRSHPNYWHATGNLDWWEVDLGREYAVTKIVIYNRQDCCDERMQDALLTTLDAGRTVINSVTLNANKQQEYHFSPFVGAHRLYLRDGSRNNQLYLVNEVREANVPCASATFDNTFVAKSNWGHDALLTGAISYFSFTNGVQSYGDLANLAAEIQENPQNAPGNWLKSNVVLVPGYTSFDKTFANAAVSRATLAPPGPMYTRPAMFSRNNQNYLDFGHSVADPNEGISFVASFAFTGDQAGSWERVFDFGSGPGTGNFVLARQGGGNDLTFIANIGGGFDSGVVAHNVIRPGKLFVAVGTHAKGTTKLYLNGVLVGQHTGRQQPGLRSFSQSFLGRSNWGHDAFFNGQIFYFQMLNSVINEPHQRVIYDRLKVASNSVIGYIPASAPHSPPAAPVDLRDAALPCGNDLLANEGLTNEEGTARLIMQADGNLVLYNKNGKALWASGTAGSVGDRLEVQSDGNLVVYQGHVAKWASHSNSNPRGCELVVQDDCNLVLYKSNAEGAYGNDNALGNFKPSDALWNSATHGRCNEPLFN